MRRPPLRTLTVVPVTLALLGAALLSSAVLAQGEEMKVTMVNANGNEIGEVRMSETRFGTVDVEGRLRGLEPGFHGFHIAP